MSVKASRDKGERRYTSIACLSCRRRKTKCNNEQPRCSNCVLYDNECIYGQDRRRTSSAVAAISERVDQLHGDAQRTFEHADPSDHTRKGHGAEGTNPAAGTFPDHGLDLENNSRNDFDNVFSHATDVEPDWAYWASPPDTVQLFSNATLEQNNSFPMFDALGSFQPDQYHHNFNADSEPSETSPNSQGLSPDYVRPVSLQAVVQQEVAPIKGTRSRAEGDDTADDALGDITKQLTSRLGRLQIAEDGKPRYYGATSNLHLLYGGASSLTQPNIRHVLTHGDAAIASAGVRWERNEAFEMHLINLFFAWHNNLQFPVDKAIFIHERERFRQGFPTDLFAPSLENAVLCVGSAYTDRSFAGIDQPVDEFFALRSKAYLDIEIDSPTIATAQALVILSSHEAAHTRESRGWIYMGMAVRIITDLGLHLDLEKDYSQLESQSEDNFENMRITRRNVFWTIKSTDTLWSAYSGRPSTMKNMVSNQKQPLPSHTYEWQHYVDEHTKLLFPPDFDRRAAAYVHIHLAALMLILAKVSEVLYSGVPDVMSDVQSFVDVADADFQNWYDALPSAMRLDLSKSFIVQSVMELHLIYHESIILLHRPLITPVESESARGITSDHQTAAHSLKKCVDSAHQICDIMFYYRDKYGLKRLHHQMVHAAMTAALIHAYTLCSTAASSEDYKKASAAFLTCIQALGEMGQTFKSASRALDVVTSLRQSWREDSSAGDRFKRARLR